LAARVSRDDPLPAQSLPNHPSQRVALYRPERALHVWHDGVVGKYCSTFGVKTVEMFHSTAFHAGWTAQFHRIEVELRLG
jgi:hypothetical protein